MDKEPIKHKFTLAALPFARPVCQQAPLSINQIEVSCPEGDIIESIFSLGIVDEITVINNHT